MYILCELRICTNIEGLELFKRGQLENNSVRINQYVNGLKKFFELNSHYIDNNLLSVYLTDNTLSDKCELDKSILNVLHPKCEIITCINNKYGCNNKGAGDIEQWIYNKDLINKYKWFIHFEPRQLLKSNQFIDSFLENPRNLFNMNWADKRQYNTGLFCIKCKVLLDFINEYTPEKLVNNNLNIEASIYNFITNNNIDYKTIDKMDLIWFPTNEPPCNM